MIRSFIETLHKSIDFSGTVLFDEPLSRHTTFRVGGPAEVLVRPSAACFQEYAALLLSAARRHGIPIFILGGGANLVVADSGIKGIVLDTGSFSDTVLTQASDGSISVRAGTHVNTAVDLAAAQALSGFEFLAGLPGSIGGAVYMNAQCYGHSIADTLESVTILNETGALVSIPFKPEDYGYKRSPFQNSQVLIMSARCRLHPGVSSRIQEQIAEYRTDRLHKGQYRFPSAGSMFKNNPAFGKPTGMIIAALGLRGLQRGGAAVSPFHGNIIINTGQACAADIRAVVAEVAARVKAATGFDLELEVIFTPELPVQ
ncbi:MAG: UDP-N-acetylmuramate dehydrogenase [Spirochaetaceae bacterium]|jgi:UDP-N-acetylmuramate dehydrogenase|nr:UDP-N-acetylmuramate dehydrogenase [Spirochaetaceae bacterium]